MGEPLVEGWGHFWEGPRAYVTAEPHTKIEDGEGCRVGEGNGVVVYSCPLGCRQPGVGRAPESTQPLEKGSCNAGVACTGRVNEGSTMCCAVGYEEAPFTLCSAAAEGSTVGVK